MAETPASAIRRHNVDMTLVHRLRRWPNIKSTLFVLCLVCGRLLSPGLCTVLLDGSPAPHPQGPRLDHLRQSHPSKHQASAYAGLM